MSHACTFVGVNQLGMAEEEVCSEKKQGGKLVHTLIGSSLSGILARIPCHPIDTIKSRLQSASGAIKYTGPVHCAHDLLSCEGVRGFYRGFGVVTVLGAPATCLYITTYEASKRAMGAEESDLPFVKHFLAGMIAEAASCALFVPVDVVKERLQVQGKSDALRTCTRGVSVKSTVASAAAGNGSLPPLYSGSWDALKVISRTEGIFGLYKGYFATLASFGPFSAMYFLLYEEARRCAAKIEGAASSSCLSTSGTLVASAGAGMLASIVTNPLDLAKLRFQTQRRLSPGEPIPEQHLRGIWHSLVVVFREGGLTALFRGAGTRAAFHAPSTCITFTCFEECRKLATQYV